MLRSKSVRYSLTLVTLTLTLILSACGNSVENTQKASGNSDIIQALKTTELPILGKIYSTQNDKIDPSYFNSTEQDCYNVKDPATCFLSILENTVTVKGGTTALAQLKSFSNKFQPYCNNVSNSLGKYFALKKIATIEITNDDPTLCGDAFSQGFFDYAISNSNTDDKTLSGICSVLEKTARWSCSNHLGVYFMNSSIKEPVAAAFKCYGIPSPDDTKGDHMTFRRSCLSGAWHEFFNNTQVIDFFKSKNVVSDDIFAFCLASERSAKEVCLQEDSNPFWVLPQFSSVDNKFKSCRDLGDRDLTDQCYFGMGRGVADHAQRDISKTYNTCLLLKNINDKEYCFIAAGEAMDRVKFSDTAVETCSDFNNLSYCNLNLGMMAYGMFSGDHNMALEYCEKAVGGNRELCSEGVFAGWNRISFVHSEPKTIGDLFAKCLSETDFNKDSCQKAATHGIGNYIEKLKPLSDFVAFCKTLGKDSVNCAYALGVTLGSNTELTINADSCSFADGISSESCAKALGEYQSYSGAKANTYCAKLDGTLKEVCAIAAKNASLR